MGSQWRRGVDIAKLMFVCKFSSEICHDVRQTCKCRPKTWLHEHEVLPYVKGVYRNIDRSLQGIRAVFKSETKLRSHLLRPKDAVDPAKQDGVIYRIPCKPTPARLEHPCPTRPYPDLRPFQTTPTTPYITRFGMKWSLLIVTGRVKEAIRIRLQPNNINRDSGS